MHIFVSKYNVSRDRNKPALVACQVIELLKEKRVLELFFTFHAFGQFTDYRCWFWDNITLKEN